MSITQMFVFLTGTVSIALMCSAVALLFMELGTLPGRALCMAIAIAFPPLYTLASYIGAAQTKKAGE